MCEFSQQLSETDMVGVQQLEENCYWLTDSHVPSFVRDSVDFTNNPVSSNLELMDINNNVGSFLGQGDLVDYVSDSIGASVDLDPSPPLIVYSRRYRNGRKHFLRNSPPPKSF